MDSFGLDAFGSEEASVPAAEKPEPHVRPARVPTSRQQTYARLRVPLISSLVVLLFIAVSVAAIWAYQRRGGTAIAASQLTVETTPPGIEVVIAGELKGRTPLTLELPAGDYDVHLGNGARQRVLRASLVPGRSLVERVEMPPPVITGSLRVESEPSNLQVHVDGTARGTSPVTVVDLSPGEHQIVVAGQGGPVRRTVAVRPNETVSLIVSAAERPASAAGWVTVSSPVRLQMREDGKVIGSTDMDRVMLPAGTHTIDLVNDSLGYRAQRRVAVAAGATAHVALQVPSGTLSINAQPWAEVWLDGKRLGETPLGNVAAPIGSHELIFRHPELGERKASVSIGLTQPARVGMDMRKK